MARQPSLLDEAAVPGSGGAVLVIRGSTAQLTVRQRQFNKLLGEVAALRERLAEWNQYEGRFRQRIATEQAPLVARLREARIALCAVFDRALLGKGLGKVQRRTAHDVLENLLSDLLQEAPDEELAAMAGRHEMETDLDDGRLDFFESVGSELFGFDIDPGHGARTVEELLDMYREKAAAETAARAERAARRKPRPKSAKAQQREERAEQVARDASAALREVYRRLVRDLHPDRIRDAGERDRKTMLMKEANRAYEAHDLLALLELQWQTEQIDAASMAGYADERLARFIHVLKAQAAHLKSELGAATAPFLATFPDMAPRDFRPVHVDRQVDRELVAMREELAQLQGDLRRYADPAELRRDLSGPLRDMLAGPDFDALLEELMWQDEAPASRRSGRRR
ncbi:MAG: hypothetical protein J0H15_11240 [Xanthomonadales bacterium]|nr:hypothetical protein [Xanthomonadales bacterium]